MIDEANAFNPKGRIYTVRGFDPIHNVLTIEVVLNEKGEVSTWLADCQPGDECYVAGSRGGFAIDEEYKSLVLAGDETALPAISAILNTLSDDIQTNAFIEISDQSKIIDLKCSTSSKISWIYRDRMSNPAADSVKAATVRFCNAHPESYVWAAGEAEQVRTLRRALLSESKLEAKQIQTIAYWKSGEADYRDASAG